MSTYKERYQKNISALHETYRSMYRDEAAFKELVSVMDLAEKGRPRKLTERDSEGKDDWFLAGNIVAYMVYIDLFSGDIGNFICKVPYLHELGITYVHLMPFLQSRPLPNDGGYAVSDYKKIDERLGSMDDFRKLIAELQKYGIHCCSDFVMNHTAREHEWARRAEAGERKYQDYYMLFDDQSIVDEYNRTVPYVLPKVKPGNFTYNESMQKWVFTSFNDYQWDLNYKNPHLFNSVVENLLFLCNLGIDIIRLDAIPFIWKELYTNGRNLPGAHKVVEMIHLVTDIVCPTVAIKGEAIVQPEEVVRYFGEGRRKECDIMYNATEMVQLWSTLATRDVRMMVRSYWKNCRKPDGRVWINYVRCHDDIGWGFDSDLSWEMGWDPESHKQFLISFYKGTYPGSFAKGELYEFDSRTLDARISGTTASLCGFEKAIEQHDAREAELALRRIILLHGILLFQDGIPMIYSGDELGQLNDWSYVDDPLKCEDSRWVHRGTFDWTAVKEAEDPDSYPGRIFSAIRDMIQIRKSDLLFDSSILCSYQETDNIHILLGQKSKGGKKVILLGNFSESHQRFHPDFSLQGKYQNLFTGEKIYLGQEFVLQPCQLLWIRSINGE